MNVREETAAARLEAQLEPAAASSGLPEEALNLNELNDYLVRIRSEARPGS